MAKAHVASLRPRLPQTLALQRRTRQRRRTATSPHAPPLPPLNKGIVNPRHQKPVISKLVGGKPIWGEFLGTNVAGRPGTVQWK